MQGDGGRAAILSRSPDRRDMSAFHDKQLVQTIAELIVALQAIVESYKSYITLLFANHTFWFVARYARHTNTHIHCFTSNVHSNWHRSLCSS